MAMENPGRYPGKDPRKKPPDRKRKRPGVREIWNKPIMKLVGRGKNLQGVPGQKRKNQEETHGWEGKAWAKT